MMKTCTECGVEKQETDFYEDKRSKTGGREAKCKRCRGAAEKKRPPLRYRAKTNGTKECKDCGLIEPLTDFPINRASKGGRQPRCNPCHNLWMNTKRRNNGPIFRPVFISTLIPEHTDYKTGVCEVCSIPYPLIRHTGRHKRCDDCSVIVRDIHGHLTHQRNGKDVPSDTGGSLVGLAVGIARLYIRQNRCQYCGVVLDENNPKHVDHIVPICLGGIHSLSNIAICCRRCNMAKGRATLAEWFETCRLVSKHADANYHVPMATMAKNKAGDRVCAVCDADIHSLQWNAIYCLPCKKIVRRLSSSLTSSRGSKPPDKCPTTTVVDVARRWLGAEKCCYCERPFSDERHRSVDHIVPMCIVGENRLNNLAISCLECNRCKCYLVLADWIDQCKRVVKHYGSCAL